MIALVVTALACLAGGFAAGCVLGTRWVAKNLHRVLAKASPEQLALLAAKTRLSRES